MRDELRGESSDRGAARGRGRPKAWDDRTAQNTIKSLDRAMAVFEHLSTTSGATLSELAADTDQSPATTYRILVTLEARGLVEFDPGPQLWHVGPRAFLIGARYLRRTSLVERARPVLRRLMEDRARRRTSASRATGTSVREPGGNPRLDPGVLSAGHAVAHARLGDRQGAPGADDARGAGARACRGRAGAVHRPHPDGCRGDRGGHGPNPGNAATPSTTRRRPRACAASRPRSWTCMARSWRASPSPARRAG
jgi:hypothetical protein